jgi:hypothetical protein
LVLWLLAWQGAEVVNDYPRAEEFARRVRQSLRLDYELQQHFVYLERRRDVKISTLGKVAIGPLRTFEVYPSEQPGQTYKRLIAVEGKPLTAEELAKRDAERQRDLARQAERLRTETASQRAERLRKSQEEERHRERVLDDVVAVFAPDFAGREILDGRRILVANLKPRADARVATREGQWMKNCEARIWVDEASYQVVKLDMWVVVDVTIGWGIVGRLHEGSRFAYARRHVDGTWVPTALTYQASGRTLLFRPFQFAVTTTYSDYRRR